MSFASDIGRMVARGPQRPMTDAESMTMLQIAWDAQKITEERAKAIGVDGTVNGPNNVLDYAEAWK